MVCLEEKGTFLDIHYNHIFVLDTLDNVAKFVFGKKNYKIFPLVEMCLDNQELLQSKIHSLEDAYMKQTTKEKEEYEQLCKDLDEQIKSYTSTHKPTIENFRNDCFKEEE
jgi:4-hydroxy-3-methylbut-2-enyl diphosphate reductase IspH